MSGDEAVWSRDILPKAPDTKQVLRFDISEQHNGNIFEGRYLLRAEDKDGSQRN